MPLVSLANRVAGTKCHVFQHRGPVSLDDEVREKHPTFVGHGR